MYGVVYIVMYDVVYDVILIWDYQNYKYFDCQQKCLPAKGF